MPFKKLLSVNILFFLVIMIVSLTLSAVLKNEITYDFMNYHYYNAWAFLNNRLTVDIPAASLNTFFNPLLDLPLYFYIQFFNNHVSLIHALQGIWTGLFLFALYKINTLFLPSSKQGLFYNVLILLLALTAQSTYMQTGSSSNEISVGFFILWGLYLLLKTLKSEKQKLFSFALTGFIMGCALAAKPTSVTYCVSSGLMLIFLYKDLRKPLGSILLFALGGFCGYITVNGYFMYLYLTAYGNPFAPMLNNIFHSAYFSDLNYFDRRFIPSFKQFLIYPYLWRIWPWRFMELPYNDIRLALYYTVAVLLSFYFIKKQKRSFFSSRDTYILYLLFLFSFLFWMSFFSIIHYTVVIEALGALFAVKLFWDSPLSHQLWSKSIFYIIVIALVIFSHFYYPWGKVLSAKKLEVERISLPDHSLVKIYGIFSSFLIPEIMKDNNCTVTTHYSQYNIIKYGQNYLLMEDYDFVERGPFLKKRNKIENESYNAVVYIINTMFFRPVTQNDRASSILENIYLPDYSCRPLRTNLVPIFQICMPHSLLKK